MAAGLRLFPGRNFYDGRCVKCGVRVRAGEGYAGLVGNQKVIWCIIHKPTAAELNPASAEAPGVYGDLSTDGSRIEFVLKGRLGLLFDKYRSVKSKLGVRSENRGGTWYDVVPIPNVGTIHKAWQDAGLAVSYSARAAAAIQGAAAQVKVDEGAAQVRLAHPKAAGLFPFQRVGVQWLVTRQGAILADEMGCGKTIETLMAIGDNRPVLLVVPASLKLNWQRETEKWRPEYKTAVLEGKTSFRWPAPGEIVILNYDILPQVPAWKGFGPLPDLTGALAGAPDRLILVADEGHALKSAKALRTTRWRLLAEIARTRGGQVWMLTGTPLLNRPPELWTVFQSAGIAREVFGSFDRFKALFHARDGKYGIEWGDPSPEVPDLMRRGMLRREKKDVLADLPAKTVQRVPVAAKLAVKDRKVLDEADAKLLSLATTDERRRAVKLPASPRFEEFSHALLVLSQLKVAPCLEYLEQFAAEDQPFLVFAAHNAPLEKLKAGIEALERPDGQKVRCGLIYGATPVEERQQIVDDFQAGRLDAVCLNIRAGGVGLTLTRATNSVFLELEVVPALNVQAEDRIHRIGQALPVTIHQIVLDHPLDQHIHSIVEAKMELIRATVGAATLLPTEEAPADERGGALVEIAGGLLIGDAPDKQPNVPGKIERVEYVHGTKRRVVQVPQLARPPKDEREEWAAGALSRLTAADPDRAVEKNDAGWNGADSDAGHAMTALVESGHGLADQQWQAALAMLRKYHRQVGRAPSSPDEPEPEETGQNLGALHVQVRTRLWDFR